MLLLPPGLARVVLALTIPGLCSDRDLTIILLRLQILLFLLRTVGFEFPTHQEKAPVQQLPVYLKGMQTVYFSDNHSASQLASKVEKTRSKLMAFFIYNEQFADGCQHLYSEFPAHFTWKQPTRTWETRQRSKGVMIGRVYHFNPVASERYYLRLFLTSVRDPRSFEELYTVNGVRHAS